MRAIPVGISPGVQRLPSSARRRTPRIPGSRRSRYRSAVERLFVGADPWCPFFFDLDRGQAMAVAVRAARPDDWSTVAGFLVELGRGSRWHRRGPHARMQFRGTLAGARTSAVAECRRGDRSAVDMEYHQRLGDPTSATDDLVVTEGVRGDGVGRDTLGASRDASAGVSDGFGNRRLARRRSRSYGWSNYGGCQAIDDDDRAAKYDN